MTIFDRIIDRFERPNANDADTAVLWFLIAGWGLLGLIWAWLP